MLLAQFFCTCQSLATPLLILLALAVFELNMKSKPLEGSITTKLKNRARNLRVIVSTFAAIAVVTPIFMCEFVPIILTVAGVLIVIKGIVFEALVYPKMVAKKTKILKEMPF